MAIQNRKYLGHKLTHHSNRDIQCCNLMYTEFAEVKGIIMSTTEKQDPYKHAIAERINRTFK